MQLTITTNFPNWSNSQLLRIAQVAYKLERHDPHKRVSLRMQKEQAFHLLRHNYTTYDSVAYRKEAYATAGRLIVEQFEFLAYTVERLTKTHDKKFDQEHIFETAFLHDKTERFICCSALLNVSKTTAVKIEKGMCVNVTVGNDAFKGEVIRKSDDRGRIRVKPVGKRQGRKKIVTVFAAHVTPDG